MKTTKEYGVKDMELQTTLSIIRGGWEINFLA
jgi:hypothetical protein